MKRGFDGIQGLRALAAAAVALLHVSDEAGALVGTPGQSPYPFLDRLPLEAGVDLFFVISGFVMVWASWDAFGQVRSVAPFVWRRLLRIVPLYWLLSAATVAVALAAPGAVSDGVRDGWGYIAASFAFVPWRRTDGFVQPVLRLGWTLEYEMAFYVLVACVLPLPRRVALPALCSALLLLAAAGQAIAFAAAPLAFWTDPIMGEFILGVAVAVAAKRDWHAGVAGPLLFAASVLLMAQLPDGTARALVRGVPAALLVFCALSWSTLPRWLVLLGDASYALYLVHPFPMRARADGVRAVAGAERAGLPRRDDGRMHPAGRGAAPGRGAAHPALGAPGVTTDTVLVVGASGVFGARLVTGLVQTTALHVIAAGRNGAKLAAVVARHPAGRVTAMVMDARTVTPVALAVTGAFAVVDAAGPYQGGATHLAASAMAAGLHFIDLADARDHVAGFASLDAAARAAGVVALTGASSTPALSNAALDMLTAGWTAVEEVAVAISPGNRAPRGLSVMRSILSYAGRPVRVFADGRWGSQPGWGMTVRRTMPGLGRRWLALSETPDLDILPQRHRTTRSAVFPRRAGIAGAACRAVAGQPAGSRRLAALARPVRPPVPCGGGAVRTAGNRSRRHDGRGGRHRRGGAPGARPVVPGGGGRGWPVHSHPARAGHRARAGRGPGVPAGRAGLRGRAHAARDRGRVRRPPHRFPIGGDPAGGEFVSACARPPVRRAARPRAAPAPARLGPARPRAGPGRGA